jgi:hypothetical protein
MKMNKIFHSFNFNNFNNFNNFDNFNNLLLHADISINLSKKILIN